MLPTRPTREAVLYSDGLLGAMAYGALGLALKLRRQHELA